ncbi:MAG: PEP-utilizing enzyme [Mycobacterium sp.]
MLGSAFSTADTTGVLVAADLTPAEAAELVPDQVAAVVLAFGSPHAHNVILLRAKGIAAVVGAGPAVLNIAEGTVVAVDGTRGEVTVDTPDDVRRQFGDRVAAMRWPRSAIRSTPACWR